MVKFMITGIGIALLLGFFSLIMQRSKAQQAVKQIEQRLLQSTSKQQQFTKASITALPPPVQRYFLHAIAPGTPLVATIKLSMSGQFRLAENKPWLTMRAQEILTPQGFLWKATLGHGLSRFHGEDYYCNQVGGVQFALLGLIPVAQAQGPAIARSAIGRLAGELMWLPSALLPQYGVNWSTTDDHTIQAHFNVDHEPITLTLIIDDNGRLLESSVLRWGEHTPERHWAYIPMGGRCYAERTFGGFTIPSQIGEGWWFGSAQYFEFFQSTIDQVEF